MAVNIDWSLASTPNVLGAYMGAREKAETNALAKQALQTQQARQQTEDRRADERWDVERGGLEALAQDRSRKAQMERVTTSYRAARAITSPEQLEASRASLARIDPDFQTATWKDIQQLHKVGQALAQRELVKGSDGSYSSLDAETHERLGGYTPPRDPKFEQLDPNKDTYEIPGRPAQVEGALAPSASGGVQLQNYTPDDVDALTRMLVGEAIGEGEEGMAAAAHVARTRAEKGWQGAASLRDVVYAPRQFEAMTRDDVRNLSPQDPRYQQARQIAEGVLSGQIPDPTGGATNFINPDLQADLGRNQPGWAPQGQGRRIGRHVFYGGGNQGGEAQPYEVASSGETLGPPSGPRLVSRAQPKQDTPPSGYRYQSDGSLAFIPGGPADPATKTSAGLKPVPAKIQSGYVDNAKGVTQIDAAIEAIKANPKALGADAGSFLRNAMGDNVSQRLNPGGVSTRAAVANIGSLLIHDRSGAAVTAAETPRLLPFIPQVNDTPEAAIKKLQGLKTELANANSQIEVQFGEESGYRPIRGADVPTAPDARKPQGGGKPPGWSRQLTAQQRATAGRFKGATGTPGSAQVPYAPVNEAEYARLPSGAHYIHPTGKIKVKP